MQNFHFKENVFNNELDIQIIKLNKSFFIHLSSLALNFDNLTLSIFNDKV